ncbi:MAG: ABC transporter permease [Bacteroidetes bacterium]|nr:ABC transporter permease [Bacteroidota bacterium]MCL1969193.1 ABC transporter permease [Bacteroidota bacterium]
MFDLDKFHEIWQTITRNKTRSILTAFGVFWGMFMFIGMLGIGQGFENGLKKMVNVTTNSMFVMARTTTVEYKGFNAGRWWNMNRDDIELLKKQIPEIKAISGMIWLNNVKAVFKEKNSDVTVLGIDNLYYEIENQNISSGRGISYLDVLERRKVCVLGNEAADELFTPDEDPVGQMIKVGAVYFTIVGTVKSRGQMNLFSKPGTTAYIPSSTAQQLEGNGNSVDMIAIVVPDDVKVNKIEAKVKDVLRAKHLISPEDNNAVMTMNLQDAFLMFHYLFLGIASLIWIVGMGTLLAGVVGISNIMLVTVKERTNEIGIKRALGAKPKVITRQIMMESLLLTFIAGFLGMFFGILVLVLTEKGTEHSEGMFANPTISFTMAIVGTIILVLSGLIAGIIPAKNALKIKAIDALRDE